MADNVGYIAPATLAPGKVKEVAAAVESLQKQGAQKLILDLRNCAVGTPQDGIALANLFLAKGEITYLQGQKVARQDFDADAFEGHHQAAAGCDHKPWHRGWRGDCRGCADGRQARGTGRRTNLRRRVPAQSHHHGRWRRHHSFRGQVLLA
jgi:hypothetical protein